MPSPPTHLPTVFVVDDDADVRDALRTLLAALGYPVRAFASCAEFESAYTPDWPGCLILDIWLPEESGLEFYERLLRSGVRIPVVFITAHADVSTAVAAMKTGAVEFLEKPFDRGVLVDRVTKALRLDTQWRKQHDRYHELDCQIGQLSRVDRETLDLLLTGVPNKVMATRLGVTERAVELRRQRLMQRLHVASLAELLDLAVTHRVLSELRALEPQLLDRR
jgi:FixJ family two-component response regulator